MRAAIAALASSAALAGLFIAFRSAPGYHVPWLGLATGIGFVVFPILAGLLLLSLMLALWRGSVAAARTGVLMAGAGALVYLVQSVVELEPVWFRNGDIWFHLATYGIQLSLIAGLGLGSAVVLFGRGNAWLQRMLAQNRSVRWRTAIFQLCGVVLPPSFSLRRLLHKSVILSLLAFCFEGAGFYVYFRAARNIEKMREAPHSFLAGVPSPIEGHYFGIATIVFFVVPLWFAFTRIALSGAEFIRRAARRAAVRSAEEMLAEDPRHPILFLRAFDDDQLSLESASMPAYTRLVDPGMEHGNVEDVLLTCVDLGPAVAVGHPQDASPPIGVFRQYVRDGSWKEVVVRLMEKAGLIVAGIAASEGLLWEMEQLRDRGALGKSVFIMPPADRWNNALLGRLLAELLSARESAASDALRAELDREIRGRQIVGLTVMRDTATVFLSDRPLSQVEVDATLRLSLLLRE